MDVMVPRAVPPFAVDEPSQVGEARRRIVELGASIGLDSDQQGRLALVVNELAVARQCAPRAVQRHRQHVAMELGHVVEAVGVAEQTHIVDSALAGKGERAEDRLAAWLAALLCQLGAHEPDAGREHAECLTGGPLLVRPGEVVKEEAGYDPMKRPVGIGKRTGEGVIEMNARSMLRRLARGSLQYRGIAVDARHDAMG